MFGPKEIVRIKIRLFCRENLTPQSFVFNPTDASSEMINIWKQKVETFETNWVRKSFVCVYVCVYVCVCLCVCVWVCVRESESEMDRDGGDFKSNLKPIYI